MDLNLIVDLLSLLLSICAKE